jgi:hypothetical protein
LYLTNFPDKDPSAKPADSAKIAVKPGSVATKVLAKM